MAYVIDSSEIVVVRRVRDAMDRIFPLNRSDVDRARLSRDIIFHEQTRINAASYPPIPRLTTRPQTR